MYGRICVFLFILFVISLFKSCQELDYSISGVVVDGLVVQTDIEERSYGKYGTDIRQVPVVYYRFNVPNQRKGIKGELIVSEEEFPTYQQGDVLSITYIGDRPMLNTPTQERSSVWVMIFLFFMSCLGLGLYALYRDAKRDLAERDALDRELAKRMGS